MPAGHRHGYRRQQHRKTATQQQEAFGPLQGAREGFTVSDPFPLVTGLQLWFQPLVVVVKHTFVAGKQVDVFHPATFLDHTGAGNIVHMHHHPWRQ